MKKLSSAFGVLGISLVLVACNSGTRQSTRAVVPFTPEISINEVMIAQIDHAAHFIWNAADPDNSTGEVDWGEIEHHAIQLISSRSAMTMGGTGVNDAMWIAQPGWRNYVTQMNAASIQALNAARDQNFSALGSAGDNLVESCEGCHQQYKPDIPTEGLLHPH